MKGRTLAVAGAGLGVGVLAAAAMAGGFCARRPYDWAGKVALVTGGSRGLGLVLARELVCRGARVAICARDRVELASARAELAARGDEEAFAVVCDLTDANSVRSMIRTVEQRLGPIDALFNNAGVIAVGPADVMGPEDYERALRTHFWAPLYTTMAVLPGMRERGGGRIVNISSIGGKVAVPHMAPYCASKFALAGVGEALAEEFRRYGVYITTVFPGLMQTGSPVNALFKGRHRAEYTWFALSSSVPGLVMSPEKAARRVLRAAERGRAQLVVGLPAKLAAAAHGLMPETWVSIMAGLNRVLPGPGGIEEPVRGRESETAVSTSFLTRAVYRAAERNNQFAASRPPFAGASPS
ncbi:MAG: SDR family NAD(P)-dependent oxidoreductase [Phycisphaerales bacterium]